jgi:hypothetical protein
MQFSAMKSIKFVEIKGGFSNCVADWYNKLKMTGGEFIFVCMENPQK